MLPTATADPSWQGRIHIDIIILDNSLPLKNGIEVCTEIRAAGSTVPIIFLSVVGDTKSKVDCLEKGADDYLTKPFSFDELKARVKALLRRPQKLTNTIITAGNLVIDTEKQTVMKDELPLYLTRKEYSLLEYFMRNQGVVLSRSMIMEHVWNADGDPFSNTVESHIVNLRRKLSGKEKKDFIRNLPGRGYIIEA